ASFPLQDPGGLDMHASMRSGLLAGLTGLWMALAGCNHAAPPQTPKPPLVTVSQPVEREVVDYREFTGRTAAVEAVSIRARVSGYLDKIAFREGAEVKQGEVLFEIDPRPYKAQWAQAEGNLA